jgi:hypothetical protein
MAKRKSTKGQTVADRFYILYYLTLSIYSISIGIHDFLLFDAKPFIRYMWDTWCTLGGSSLISDFDDNPVNEKWRDVISSVCVRVLSITYAFTK